MEGIHNLGQGAAMKLSRETSGVDGAAAKGSVANEPVANVQLKKALGGASDYASQVQALTPREGAPVQMKPGMPAIRMPEAGVGSHSSKASKSPGAWEIGAGGALNATSDAGYEPRAGGEGGGAGAKSPWASVRSADEVIAMAAAAAGHGNFEGQLDWIDEQKASGSIPPDKRYLAQEAAMKINKRR